MTTPNERIAYKFYRCSEFKQSPLFDPSAILLSTDQLVPG
jgi:hypothetical protein